MDTLLLRARVVSAGYFSRAASLLARAQVRYREGDLAPQPGERRGFEGGARWMARALGQTIDDAAAARAARLSWVKYGSAAAVGLAAGALGACLHPALAPVGFVLGFYAVEVQGVFLMPAVVRGAPSPWTHSRRTMVRAGGTVAAMCTVIPLAGWMLVGGVVAHGSPVRAWCEGATAVVLWYGDLRP